MSSSRLIRIGTRSSPMALAQVDRVRTELAAHLPGLATEVVPITTSADRWAGPISELGGKGAFTKEIDAALLAGDCDVAVHCIKDVPGDRPVPAGLVFAAYLARDDARDALVLPAARELEPPAAREDDDRTTVGPRGGVGLDDLPGGARIGTSAVRRSAQLARTHPHLHTVPIRGNANTRLAKLDAGEVDALLLSAAGLERIGQAERVAQVLPVELMCPPVGAGVLGVACREDDTAVIEAVSHVGDTDTWRQTTAERMLLHVLQGHCNSPIAGYAYTEPDGRLALRAKVFSPDGKTVLDAYEWGPATDPTTLGVSVALTLLRQGARELIDAIPH